MTGNEWIKETGIEMVQSFATLFKRVEGENKISMQWKKTKIKSVYKRGNKQKDTRKSKMDISNEHSM